MALASLVERFILLATDYFVLSREEIVSPSPSTVKVGLNQALIAPVESNK